MSLRNPAQAAVQALNKSGLPIGVRKNKKYRGYSANRMVAGKKYRLGSFLTIELAQAAYLDAVEKYKSRPQPAPEPAAPVVEATEAA